jgi:hypothetical protein
MGRIYLLYRDAIQKKVYTLLMGKSGSAPSTYRDGCAARGGYYSQPEALDQLLGKIISIFGPYERVKRGHIPFSLLSIGITLDYSLLSFFF